MLRAQGLAEQMTDSKLSHYTTCGFVANGWTWFHTIISASQATLLNERCSENPATLAVTITMSWLEQYFTSDNFSKAGLQSLRSVVISCPCLVNCLPRQLILLAPDPLRSMTPCPFLKDSTFTWTVSLNLVSHKTNHRCRVESTCADHKPREPLSCQPGMSHIFVLLILFINFTHHPTVDGQIIQTPHPWLVGYPLSPPNFNISYGFVSLFLILGFDLFRPFEGANQTKKTTL